MPKSPVLAAHTAEKGAVNTSCTVDSMNLTTETRITRKTKFLFKVNNFSYIQSQWLNMPLKFSVGLNHYKNVNQNCRAYYRLN